jgi:predicted Zn-dependent protease
MAIGTATISMAGSVLLVGFILLFWAADLSSCFSRGESTRSSMPRPRPPLYSAPDETRLVNRLLSLSVADGRSPSAVTVWILDDPAVNAASVGRGVFVAWAGLSVLSDADMDAVYAHELAHDRLKHAQKTSELADVLDFVGEALAMFSRQTPTGADTLKRWSGQFVVPRYQRQQELDADAAAVAILRRQRYDNPVAVLCSAFAHLRSKAGEAGGGLFDSHPALSERMNKLAQLNPNALTQRACK